MSRDWWASFKTTRKFVLKEPSYAQIWDVWKKLNWKVIKNRNIWSQSFRIEAPPIEEGHGRSRRTVSFKRITLNQKPYLLHYMITNDDHMTFYLAFAGEKDDLTDSKVSFIAKSRDGKIQTTYCTEIILIDEAPLTEEDLMTKREVWCLSKKSWSKLLSIERKSVLNSFSLFVSVS